MWENQSSAQGNQALAGTEAQMFKIGQKVRDSQGQEGRVTDVDVCEGKASYTVRFGKYELVRFAYELDAA
jgi:hypothetical protein